MCWEGSAHPSHSGNYDVTWISLGLLPRINVYFILYPCTPKLISWTTEWSAEYFTLTQHYPGFQLKTKSNILLIYMMPFKFTNYCSFYHYTCPRLPRVIQLIILTRLLLGLWLLYYLLSLNNCLRRWKDKVINLQTFTQIMPSALRLQALFAGMFSD